MRTTLMTAERACGVREDAKRQAASILEEAHREARTITEEARRERERLLVAARRVRTLARRGTRRRRRRRRRHAGNGAGGGPGGVGTPAYTWLGMAEPARLRIRVSPGARTTELVGRRGDAWKFASPLRPRRPRQRRADGLLARRLRVAPAELTLVAGRGGRDKVVDCEGSAPRRPTGAWRDRRDGRGRAVRVGSRRSGCASRPRWTTSTASIPGSMSGQGEVSSLDNHLAETASATLDREISYSDRGERSARAGCDRHGARPHRRQQYGRCERWARDRG